MRRCTEAALRRHDFHRVIPGFMAQGGDPIGNGMGDPGYFIQDEIDPSLMFDVPGRLAMANSGPNTDGSQFFVTEEIQPSLNGHYTIFGQCDPSSVLVVKTITRVERDGRDKPMIPVTLKKVTIVPVGQSAPPPPAAAASAPPMRAGDDGRAVATNTTGFDTPAELIFGTIFAAGAGAWPPCQHSQRRISCPVLQAPMPH